ncbi:uncharacterized protein E0L32_008497 [Thyridium curvatum]|uniref:peptidylprolyl isomerase n=1 Tax=Thyridium curvatum TaxID=1093900 RepID=A0A507B0H5_9PEZI|nr:uncharacterized protein E0L32_008497 [Thyridium curvatum]TPX10611.1 hypothetical protein E0L32_008497 [Thyridium curvatum]
MSAIYNTEPQPTASVIVHTTLGDISVELFAKQTPLTCRNFLQLALDGYYDDTIFHRLVPGFILQGGDPTGTGNGGESIYDGGAFSGDLDPWPMDERRERNAGPMGVNFKDEFHSRLKFNRRGLLAMANEGSPDTNGSQFFFTLDKTEELNGKNTLFGRVVGDTIYNLAKIGESELEEGSDRPLYPIKITGVEILVNPFEDMQKRQRIAQRTDKAAGPAKKQKKRKGGKQLLSFGDDEEEGGEDLPVLKKPKFDKRIVQDVEEEDDRRQDKLSKKKATKKDSSGPQNGAGTGATAHRRRDSPSPSPKRDLPVRNDKPRGFSDGSESPEAEPEAPRKKTLLEQTNEEIAALKASMKRTVHAEPVKEERKKSAFEALIPETSTRGKKRRPGATNLSAAEEKKTLNMLRAFQSRLEKAPAPKESATLAAKLEEEGQKADDDEEGEVCDLHFIANCQSCQSWDKLEGKEDSDDEGWMSHTLSFAADKLGKDLSYRKKAEEELIVIDPREKAKNLKEEKRGSRDSKQGGSGRAWDQAKNAQLARASALAGRGAK